MVWRSHTQMYRNGKKKTEIPAMCCSLSSLPILFPLKFYCFCVAVCIPHPLFSLYRTLVNVAIFFVSFSSFFCPFHFLLYWHFSYYFQVVLLFRNSTFFFFLKMSNESNIFFAKNIYRKHSSLRFSPLKSRKRHRSEFILYIYIRAVLTGQGVGNKNVGIKCENLIEKK